MTHIDESIIDKQICPTCGNSNITYFEGPVYLNFECKKCRRAWHELKGKSDTIASIKENIVVVEEQRGFNRYQQSHFKSKPKREDRYL